MCQYSLSEDKHVSLNMVIYPNGNCNLSKVSIFRGQSKHFLVGQTQHNLHQHTQNVSSFSSHCTIRASMKRSNPSNEQSTSITCPTATKENQTNHCIRNYLCGCKRDLSREKYNSSATNLIEKFRL